MTVATVALWIVAALWIVVSSCVLVMIIDLEREWRRKYTPPPPPPVPVPQLPMVYGNPHRGVILFNDLNPPGDVWIAPPVRVQSLEAMQPQPLSPQMREQLASYLRMQARAIDLAFWQGSQSFSSVYRCDICGASTKEQKNDRCRNACGRLEANEARQLSLPARRPPPRSAV